MITIYHNNRCGKSRTCLAEIEKAQIPFEVVPYLTETPTKDKLKSILQKMNMSALQIIRTKEKIWIENYKDQVFSEDEYLEILVKNPILIQRPILESENSAKIARDMESIESFTKSFKQI